MFGGRFDSDIYSVFGLRGSLARAAGQEPVVAASMITQGVAYGAGSPVSFRLGHLAFIGAGLDGVEGGLGIDYAMGLRGKLGEHHGPFARIGLRAHLLGNHRLYSSRVELPELQLGYQLLESRVHVEVAGRGGAVLIGRYNALGGRRPLGGSLELGGYSALRYESLHLELGLTRTEARSEPKTPVDEISGLLCGIAASLGICLDARFYRGDVRANQGIRRAESVYLGLALGVGAEGAQ